MTLRRIVAVTREPEIQKLVQRVGQEIFVADDLAEALDIAETVNPDLIIFDHRFSPAHVHEFLNEADRNLMDAPIVVVGGDTNQNESAAEFMQVGTYDYLQGKNDYDRLQQIVGRIKNKPKDFDSKAGANSFFSDDTAAAASIVGRSEAIANALKMIKLVADSQCNPVLIVGETGTGKELAARAVHNIRHQGEQFVAVNCAALTVNLLESELFGHVKGSFTGANCEKTGLLELAGKGTLFLDEISEMPLNLQAKLLRVLQEKTFRKVGGVKDIVCGATIIASSNCNLYEEVQANRFRRDLYYRLNICPITIAPLKSPGRKADIGLLAEYFIKTSTICPGKTGRITSLTKLAVEALQKHNWPGNVRELRNVIERAILLETTDKIGLSSIIIDSAECNRLTNGSLLLQNSNIRDFSLSKAERELIARALQETGWQKTRAASLLGITRATLYAKVKQYNIEKDLSINTQVQDEVTASPFPQPVTTL